MIDRSVRIFNKVDGQMLYPQQGTALNIVLGLDGLPMQITHNQITKLQDCVVMYNTGLFASTKEPIWEGDIVECDVVHDFEGIQSATRERGVMVWDQKAGMWTVHINKLQKMKPQRFEVSNTRIVGDIWRNKDLVNVESN